MNHILVVCSFLMAMAVSAYVPQVTHSVRPKPRPTNLNIIPAVEDGVFHNGKIRLSISFYDEGLFYQRQEREQLIPVMYYLKNEYPNIDFSKLKMTSINLNARTLGDFSYTRFYNADGMMLAESLIPRVQNPSEVFGDYVNSTLSGSQIDNLLFVGISGIQNINNVSAHFEVGTPNFSLNLNQMPKFGNYVGEIQGFQKRGFNQTVFDDVMIEVRKMTALVNQYSEDDYQYDDPVTNWRNNDTYNDDNPNYYNPTPRVIPYRDRGELIYNTQTSYSIDRVGLFGGTLVLSVGTGEASLTGYQIQRENGRTKFTEMGTFITAYNPLRVKLKKGDSNGVITFFFSSISKNTNTFIMRER